MEKILNSTPVRTTNKFKINDIKVDIPDIEFINFDDYKIDGNYNVSIKDKFNSRIGLDYNKYLNIDLDVNKDNINLEFNVNKPLVLNININSSIDSTVNIKYIGNNIAITKINTSLNNSNIKLNVINLLDKEAYNIIEFTNTLVDSNMTTNFIDIGGKVKLSNLLTDLNSSNSTYNLNNLYLGINEDIIDMNYLINLNKPNTNSELVVEGLLNDKSKKSFKGTLDFKEGSSDSIGHENENCILLSDEAKSKSLPMMLCHEESVDGAHGVSTGKIDEEKLFYLMSRGLSKDESIRLILNANINKIVNCIDDVNLQQEIIDIINKEI
jgi:Fe-S cluster assembly scaffold protein SufB